jgi:hypothetical protein
MSDTVNGYVSKRIKATMNGENISLACTSFVCMSDSISTNQRSLTRRSNNYKKLEIKPKYLITYRDGSSVKDNIGSKVFCIPVGFDGIHDEYDLDGRYEVIGTLLRDRSKWYIETDLIKVEQLRREDTFERMRAGRCLIDYTEKRDDHRNADKYREYLLRQDEENGSFVTNGHGI